MADFVLLIRAFNDGTAELSSDLLERATHSKSSLCGNELTGIYWSELWMLPSCQTSYSDLLPRSPLPSSTEKNSFSVGGTKILQNRKYVLVLLDDEVLRPLCPKGSPLPFETLHSAFG